MIATLLVVIDWLIVLLPCMIPVGYLSVLVLISLGVVLFECFCGWFDFIILGLMLCIVGLLFGFGICCWVLVCCLEWVSGVLFVLSFGIRLWWLLYCGLLLLSGLDGD